MLNEIITGDARELAKRIPDASIDYGSGGSSMDLTDSIHAFCGGCLQIYFPQNQKIVACDFRVPRLFVVIYSVLSLHIVDRAIGVASGIGMPVSTVNLNEQMACRDVKIINERTKFVLLLICFASAIQQAGKDLFNLIIGFSIWGFCRCLPRAYRKSVLGFWGRQLVHAGNSDLFFCLWCMTLAFCGVICQYMYPVRSHLNTSRFQAFNYKGRTHTQRFSNYRGVFARKIALFDLLNVNMLYFGIKATTARAVFFIASDNALKCVATVHADQIRALLSRLRLAFRGTILFATRYPPCNLKGSMTTRALANSWWFPVA